MAWNRPHATHGERGGDGALRSHERGCTSRSYASVADLMAMQGLLVAARALTDDWRYPHIGDLIWNFFTVTCHLDPYSHIRLWHDPDSALVAYAMLSDGPTLDWHVLPNRAWSEGIEAEVMAWASSRLSDLAEREAERWGGDMVSSVRQDDEPRIAFLEAHGFRRASHREVSLLRPLADPLPQVELLAGYAARAVTPTRDTADRAGAENDVWNPLGVPPISGDDYARLMQLPGYERELDVVAIVPDGVIAAYVNGWIDPVNHIGDLGPVGARAAYRRQGLTRSVLLECLRRMQVRGMDRVCVSTGESNLPARRLYESLGFAVANTYLEYAKSPGVATA